MSEALSILAFLLCSVGGFAFGYFMHRSLWHLVTVAGLAPESPCKSIDGEDLV